MLQAALKLLLFTVLCLIPNIKGYFTKQRLPLSPVLILKRGSNSRIHSTPRPELDEVTKLKIEKLVLENKVLLFMKGNKLFPQCGFSNTACRILDAIGAPYESVNVLEDDKIRNGIKVFSQWPTIPQLYVNGEFIGGSDIMIELYQNGELAEMIEVARAS
jgi:monothiol glutaredoxin